jgi:hypothetical protein
MSALKASLENLAVRVAATQGGRVHPNDLIPWLPVSLEIIIQRLDEMVDDTIVFREEEDGLKRYVFQELSASEPKTLYLNYCVHCDSDGRISPNMPLCPNCEELALKELSKLAEKTAWPAEAVWQHEILHIASDTPRPVGVADIAARSRLTIGRVQQRLKDLVKMGCARAEIDEAQARLVYHFPPIQYKREAFLRHDQFIRTHPASLKDEWELRLVRALSWFIAIVLAAFALGFFAKIPLPLSLLGALGLGSFVAWRSLRRKIVVKPGADERD